MLAVVVLGAFGAHFCRFLFYGQDKFLTLKSPASRQTRDAYRCNNQLAGGSEREKEKKKNLKFYFILSWSVVPSLPAPTFDSINPLIAQFPPPTVAAERIDKCSQVSEACHKHIHTCNKIYPPLPPTILYFIPLSLSLSITTTRSLV